MKVEWYTDFVNYNYKPKKNDLVCLYEFKPRKGVSIDEAVGRIASESSAGTWTTLNRMPNRMKKVMAISFEVRNNFVKVAYPFDLWEPGNSPQLLSGIAGNIFGMKALDSLRLVDVSLPQDYLKRFKGPQFGIKGIKKIFKIKNRPITGAVPKPKIGFSAKEHAEVGYETWVGGFDLVKDDENLTSTSFNNFEQRVKLLTKMRQKAEKETGVTKSALINITGDVRTMEKRAKMLHNYGWEYAMVDVVTTGPAAVQTIRDVCGDYKLAIHAHRAMHAAFDRVPNHGISMLFLGKLMRMIGVDQIHIGTVVGKLVGTTEEVTNIQKEITNKIVSEEKDKKNIFMLKQNWGKLNPTLPTSSGGVHPGLIPDILKVFGNDICLLVSGGIHGHPKGTRSGAKAAMQAIEAFNKKITLEEYAKTNKELNEALGKWKRMRPI